MTDKSPRQSMSKKSAKSLKEKRAEIKRIETILKDKKKILPCSVFLQGEYGVNDLFVGVPVKLVGLGEGADEIAGRGSIAHGEIVILVELGPQDQVEGVGGLVADQLVGGVLVGDAQQRLGHAHQQHAFLAAQVVLAHEGFYGGLVTGANAHATHQIGGRGRYGRGPRRRRR